MLRALLVPIGVALLGLVRGVVDAIDLRLYDFALRWEAERQSDDEAPFVLVEIDDRSIEALGRFPWTRTTFADLFDRTRVGGASVVGVDVLFAEAADPAGDSAMAAALRSSGNVILASAAVLSRVQPAGAGGALGRLRVAERVIEPIELLAASAAGVGSVSVLEDQDGSTRRYTLLLSHLGEPYPSLAQLMLAFVARDSQESVRLDREGTMLINYGSLAPASVTRVSLPDALGLGDDEARELFEGKIVLVAATYAGGVDVGPTPLDPRTPSSFAHIYTLHTMLTGEQLRPSPAGAPFVFAVLIVGLLSTQVPARHPARLMAMAAALVAIFTAGTGALFLGGGLVLKPGLPVLATAVFVSGYGLQQWWTTNSHLRRRNRELLETLANLRRTTSSKERMEAELNIARSIQFSMVPLEFPPFPDREEFALHATLVPAREVGGDFYDFFLIDDDHLFFCVADVSGKGVPAALFMAVSKTLLKSNAAKTISPASIVSRTNDELARDNDESMFVTVWLGILTLTTGELRYTNAGHNPPLRPDPGG